MPHSNPWYLITREEIQTIRNHMENIRHHVPEQDRAALSGALAVLSVVQERFP